MNRMKVLVPGPVHAYYSQLYVEPEDDGVIDMLEAFRGQSNGICGAAQPGRLFLSTGTHTGMIDFSVELHDAEPDLAPQWEEIVEVPFHVAQIRVNLLEWAGSSIYNLDIRPGSYRARYNARGMDIELVKYEERAPEDRWPIEQYCLQLWPAPEVSDCIIKQTSKAASHRHAARTHN